MSSCPVDHGAFAQFDHHSKQNRKGAEAQWEAMRALPGLAHSDLYGGFHIVTRNADVRAAAVRHALYSTTGGAALPAEHRTPHIPEEVDPPLQLLYRKMIQPFLGEEQIDAAEGLIRRHAAALLDALGAETRVDFVRRVTEPFPVRFSLELFGFPEADAEMLFGLVETLIGARDDSRGVDASAELTSYLERFLEARAASAGSAADDIVAAIALGQIEGRPLEMWEKVSMTRLLLFGGFTTVNVTLSYTMYRFACEPELYTRLRADPGLMATALDEFVRIASAGTYIARTVQADAELAGVPLRAGDKLLLCYGSANRDPAIFADPDEVVLDRSPNPHLGFGFGTHRCMGSGLAKKEMQVILEEMFKRYDRLELDPAGKIVWGSGETQGIVSLPLILHPVKQ